MEQEEWKPVVGYEDFYEVSNLGRVKSMNYRNTGKEGIMKLRPDGDGYLKVNLSKNGKKETCQVHQLVMRAFIGKCPDGCEVDHYDWNPSNNRLDNLSYQPKEVNRGRRSPEWQKNHAEASRKACCKPVNQYSLDGQFVRKWESIMDVERELGIRNGKISNCCNGKVKSASGFIWKFAV